MLIMKKKGNNEIKEYNVHEKVRKYYVPNHEKAWKEGDGYKIKYRAEDGLHGGDDKTSVDDKLA